MFSLKCEWQETFALFKQLMCTVAIGSFSEVLQIDRSVSDEVNSRHLKTKDKELLFEKQDAPPDFAPLCCIPQALQQETSDGKATDLENDSLFHRHVWRGD